jgi:hypothetical protein
MDPEPSLGEYIHNYRQDVPCKEKANLKLDLL